MILLIDNYDSFSYNLFQLVGELNPDIKVIRNDELSLDEIRALHPDRVILSPGPGRPEDAGQAICAAFGATITYAKQLMHGKQSIAALDEDCPLFQGCPPKTKVARYHSLAADPATLPDVLKITALTADDEIMAVAHRDLPVYGVQFHPESILTPEGRTMLKNFLEIRIAGS